MLQKLTGLITALVTCAWALSAAAMELVLVEQVGCHYCEQWHAEIGPAYANTAEGRAAPLRTVQLRELPKDLDLVSRPVLTPTFILVEDGTELARIVGYPGDNWFWPLLNELLVTHGGLAKSGS